MTEQDLLLWTSAGTMRHTGRFRIFSMELQGRQAWRKMIRNDCKKSLDFLSILRIVKNEV